MSAVASDLSRFHDVIDVVREGTAVNVDTVARWQNTNYVWAKVHYGPPPAR